MALQGTLLERARYIRERRRRMRGESAGIFTKYRKDPCAFITEFLGEQLTTEQRLIAASVADGREVNVQAAHGVGKCVGEDEPITLADGTEVAAKKLTGETFKLFTLLDGEPVPVEATADWNRHEHVYEVATETGKRIVRNGQHPLFAGIRRPLEGGDRIINCLGWTSVSEMMTWLEGIGNDPSIEMVTAMPLAVPAFGRKVEDEGWLRVLADSLRCASAIYYPSKEDGELELIETLRKLARVSLNSFLLYLFNVSSWNEASAFKHPSQSVAEALQRLLLRLGVQTTLELELGLWKLTTGRATDLLLAPMGTAWEKVVSIRQLPERQCTVAIHVPLTQSYLTTFYEHNSWLGARLTIWFVFCVRGLAITTAPTERQVKNILWKEIRQCYDSQRTRLGGFRGETFLKLDESANAIGFTARDTSSDGFQGIHADRLLLIEDEANGISSDIDDGAQSCLTGEGNVLLRIGNPTVAGTPFAKSCKQSHIRVPVWSHPNVAWAYELHEDGVHRLKKDIAACVFDEERNVKPQSEWPDRFPRDLFPGAISVAWIETVRKKKGEGSAFWKSRVEALFPEDSEIAAIPRSLLVQARARYDKNPAYWDKLSTLKRNIKKWGLDVGDGGDDHGLAYWDGPVLRLAKPKNTLGDHLDTKRAASWASSEIRKLDQSAIATIMVDNIGVGAGSLGDLISTKAINAVGSNWGGASSKPDVYENVKAEQYWTLREALTDKQLAIAPLGEHEETAFDDLSAVYYAETVKGKIRMEPKKETIKRLGRSPNIGDAIIMAFNAPAAARRNKPSAPAINEVQAWMNDL